MDKRVAVFLGAYNAVSPLGVGISLLYDEAKKGSSGCSLLTEPFPGVKSLFAARFEEGLFSAENSIEEFTIASCRGSLDALTSNAIATGRWLLVLGTTKGDIDALRKGEVEKYHPHYLMDNVRRQFPWIAAGRVVSCACISGLSAMIYAADQVAAGEVDHALVVGTDALSEFTTRGFESFFALDDALCKPFDKDRKGLNLGEGAGSIVVSRDPGIFSGQIFNYRGGATSNDANHISGPSRTGEGLFRAVNRTLRAAEVNPGEVEFISAHGTGTVFNDGMESIAFERLRLSNVPLNSLKAYLGHTLGASGLLELAVTLKSMEEGLFLKTLGCQNPLDEAPVSVLLENTALDVSLALKTSSGFGGCNAAVLVEKIA